MRPPITYPLNLADLIMVADSVCELDGLKPSEADNPAEHERIKRVVSGIHNLIERVAGHDASLIYGPSEEGAA